MELKLDINMQAERQEKGHDGQIKMDEQEVPAGQEVENRCLSPRSELLVRFIGVQPAAPSSHLAEGPCFAFPGMNVNSPRPKPRYKVSRANSMSMLEQVNERRRSFEVQTSSLSSLVQKHPSAPSGGHERRKSYTSLWSPSSLCPSNAPGTPPGHRSFHRASSSAFFARASSRQSFASDGGDTFDRELAGLHPGWKNHANTFGTQQLQWAQSTRGTGTLLAVLSSEEHDQQLYACLWGRQAWEVLGLLMISLDFFAVPMQVFEPYPIELILITTILTTLYWTCDIPFSFLASQHSDGARHISLKAIARQCASSWLLFDSIMVLVNWLAVVLTIFAATECYYLSHIGSPKLLRFVSSFRFLRVPRFIFKSKAGFLALLEEHGGSKRVRIIFGIAGMLVFIVLTNHLIACAFYGIATIPGLDNNWAYYAFELTGRTSMLYRYSTSMHWAIGLFHTSGSDILPTNSPERIFVQCVIIWNLVVFSTLIAAISNALQQLRELNEERTEQFAKVRRYFSSNNVQSGLAKKTWAALSLAAQKPKRRTNWDEIKILHHLPKSLQAELHRHIREPILSVHPFFFAFDRAFTVQMQQVYQLCISEISTEQGQELFHTGEASTQMYFVLEGTFCYYAEGTIAEPSFLSTGQWVGEPVLWMSWKHTGRLLAKTPCAVLAVKSKELQEILGPDGGDAGVIIKEYAMQFTRHCHNHSFRLTDIGVDVDAVGKLVAFAFEPPRGPLQEGSDLESESSPLA
ncbi:unnamed protein product [Polarella glacialis]|uniref:Cyclic nucleotide-binding domain-containing protein n=1 Tax=Polarella glacialis TaxID=89957 RepID=A0A813EWQ0_POLGL|nr:unnamed protein product [Polarella glacialis]